MSERLMLKGALADKKQARMQMAARAAGLITGIKVIIQPAAIIPLKDLKTGDARALIRELDDLRGDYLKLTAEIEELERELI